MSPKKKAIVPKIFTLLLLPVVVGGMVYLLFEAFQSAYTSEAQIQVNEALWLDPYRDSTRLINEFTLNRRVQEVITQISSDPAMMLLGFRLAAHDFVEEPFTRHESLDDFSQEELEEFSRVLQQKVALAELEFTNGEEDQKLRKLLKDMKYLPKNLREELTATQVPGTSLIQVQGHGRSPEMSGFMVNAFCEEFIRYVSKVEKERLQDMLMVVERMHENKERELEDKMAHLGEKQHAVTDAVDEELWDLRRRITRLDNTRLKEEKRIEELKEILKQGRKEGSVPVEMTGEKSVFQKVKQDYQHELQQSLSRLEVIQKQLELLRKKLENREKSILRPFQATADSLRSSLLVLEKDRDKIKQAINYTDKLLIQVIKGKTRHPSPFTSLFLAFQAGLATLLLWLIFLQQMNFIQLFKTNSQEENNRISSAAS